MGQLPQQQTQQQLRDKATQDALVKQQHFEWINHPFTKLAIKKLDDYYDSYIGITLSVGHNLSLTNERMRYDIGYCASIKDTIENLLNPETFITK